MTSGPDHALRRAVEEAAVDAGLDAVGVTSVEAFESVRLDLEDRRAHGFHAGMSFTFKNPRRSTEPARLLRDAASMIVGARAYLEPEPDRPAAPAGRVARYAWRDHYADLKGALEAGAMVLRNAGHRAMVIADDNGLVDRAAAHRAGIGWWGKNANILLPGKGSWFVLGAIVTDAVLPAADAVVDDGCRSCTRCFAACPTGAIVDDGVIDGRRCLAWLVQDTGLFPRAHRVALGDRLYGCDDCQDACPPSRRLEPRPVAVEIGERPPDAWVPLLELLAASDEALLDRYGRWYVPRRDPRYLRRNALVVLGNVGDGADPATQDALDEVLAGADGLLRAHAVWACARLGLHDRVSRHRHDPDPQVRAEVAMAPAVPPAPLARAGAPA